MRLKDNLHWGSKIINLKAAMPGHLSYIKPQLIIFLILGNLFVLRGQKIYMQNEGQSANIYENVNGLCDFELSRCPVTNAYRGGGVSFFYPDGKLNGLFVKDQTDSVYLQFNQI